MQTGPTTRPDPASLVGGMVIAGRYRLEQKLGEGGFASVFAATNMNDGSRIALKILSPRILEMAGGIDRFRREAELAARLHHPNIVRILDAGTDPNGALFIAFELLEGRSLEEEIARVGPVDLRRAGLIACDVLAALDCAHAIGIVHRDIKPANVFLLGGTCEGQVKVLDFGIAKSTNPGTRAGLTQEGSALGTPAYMAPEQIEGGEVGPWTDVFSVGLVLAEMLGGASLFGDRPALEVLTMRLTGRALPLPPAVTSSPLGPVVFQATQSDRSRRYPTAAAMRAAVQAVLAASPTQRSWSAPPTPVSPGWSAPPAPGPQVFSATQLARPAARPSGSAGFGLVVAGALGLAALAGAVGAAMFLRADKATASRAVDDEEDEDDDEEEVASSRGKKKRARPEPTGSTGAHLLPAPEAPRTAAPTAPPAPTPSPPPATSSARVVECAGVAALQQPTLRGKAEAAGERVTGKMIYCAGTKVNFHCQGPGGEGVTLASGGNLVLVRLAGPAPAKSFAQSEASAEGPLTLAVDRGAVLRMDVPDATADKILGSICSKP